MTALLCLCIGFAAGVGLAKLAYRDAIAKQDALDDSH